MDKALCFELIFRGLRDKYGEAQVIPMFNELNLGRVFDGGARSGNFNHAGRPGLVGGSAKAEQVGIKQKQMEPINEIIKKIDFTKDNILPAVNIGNTSFSNLPAKPILLKAEVISRNLDKHNDITEEKAKEILVQALYCRDKIIPSTNENKPDYYNFTAFVEDYNYLVLLDFTPTKEYNEIVHYFIMSQKSLNALIRKAARQGKNIWEEKEEID